MGPSSLGSSSLGPSSLGLVVIILKEAALVWRLFHLTWLLPQGCPRRLAVELRLLGGLLRRAVSNVVVPAVPWAHAPQMRRGCVASVSSQRFPIPNDMLLALLLIKPALLSYR